MSVFDDLQRSGSVRALDAAFAQSLQRLQSDTDPSVLAAAALASLSVASGHAAFDPARAALLTESHDGAPPALPDAHDWQRTLAASRWVDQPQPKDAAGLDRPLVLEHGLLYLRRYREYERRLALGLQRLAAQPMPALDAAALAPLFSTLFPQGASGEDHQAWAAALALRRALLLVTGGPGTGKTTTIARLLLLCIAQAQLAGTPAPRIALAAPTGRAAERMAESLRAAVARAVADGVQLPPAPQHQDTSPLPQAGEGAQRAGEGSSPSAWESHLPKGATTLHRLLGVIPDAPQFRHNADNPLPFDLIVVDEASMVDLPLMCKLVEAVADGTQLILLGDADQLPSVEAGDVLAAILQAAGPGDALPSDEAVTLQPLLGNAPSSNTQGGLSGNRIHLRRGYRQADDFALAPLADAVRAGDAEQTIALLRANTLAGVHFHDNADDPLAAHRDALLTHWRALADADTPAQALRDAGRLRLLTAVRNGPQGARTLNARIEQLLADTGHGGRRLGAATPWFHGRLLLVTENSYRHGLFNGDVGICLRDAQGTLVAWFEGEGEDGVRGFHPAALPAHESAFAMTVHKAQGSEFDTVWLQLPARDARVLSRELVYTGITRARKALHLAGNEAVLRAALARHAARVSGLGWRLGEREAAKELPIAQDMGARQTPEQGSLF